MKSTNHAAPHPTKYAPTRSTYATGMQSSWVGLRSQK